MVIISELIKLLEIITLVSLSKAKGRKAKGRKAKGRKAKCRKAKCRKAN